MDPNQTWLELSEAIEAEDWERAGELADDLRCWLDRDGYPPHVTGRVPFDRIIAKTVCEAISSWEVA